MDTFHGQYGSTLDAHRRCVVPLPFRAELPHGARAEEQGVYTFELDGPRVGVASPPMFLKILHSLNQSTDRVTVRARQQFCIRIGRSWCDARGRIVLTPGQTKRLGIAQGDKAALRFVGVGHHMIIWTAQRRAQYEAHLDERMVAAIDRILGPSSSV